MVCVCARACVCVRGARGCVRGARGCVRGARGCLRGARTRLRRRQRSQCGETEKENERERNACVRGAAAHSPPSRKFTSFPFFPFCKLFVHAIRQHRSTVAECLCAQSWLMIHRTVAEIYDVADRDTRRWVDDAEVVTNARSSVRSGDVLRGHSNARVPLFRCFAFVWAGQGGLA